jgi:hypothetical protein
VRVSGVEGKNKSKGGWLRRWGWLRRTVVRIGWCSGMSGRRVFTSAFDLDRQKVVLMAYKVFSL